MPRRSVTRLNEGPVGSRPEVEGCLCGDRNPLNTDEFQVCWFLALNLKTKLDCFSNFHHQFVQRCRIGMTTWQLGN